MSQFRSVKVLTRNFSTRVEYGKAACIESLYLGWLDEAKICFIVIVKTILIRFEPILFELIYCNYFM